MKLIKMSDRFNIYMNPLTIQYLELKEITYGEEYRIDINTNHGRYDESFCSRPDAEKRLHALIAEINGKGEGL